MSKRHRHTGADQVPSHTANRRRKGDQGRRDPPAIAVTPDGKTACIASDGLASVTAAGSEPSPVTADRCWTLRCFARAPIAPFCASRGSCCYAPTLARRSAALRAPAIRVLTTLRDRRRQGCVDASAWAYARDAFGGRRIGPRCPQVGQQHSWRKVPQRGIDQTLWDSATGRSLAVLPVRHDGAVEDVGQRAHAAIVAGDWSTVRLLLHPYLHWTDSTGGTIRGRAKVLAMLERAAQAPAQARSIELRDGQIYRWLA